MAITNKEEHILTNLELSIQMSLSGLSFCVLNRDTNSITDLKDISFDKRVTPFEALDKLKHVFNTESVLQNSFQQVRIIHVNELSSLIPKPLFNEDLLADYLKFNTKILDTDFITYDELKSNDSVTVYIPYININNYIYDQFGTFHYTHYSTVLIDKLLQLERHATTSKLYVHVANSHFEIIAIKNGELTLYNTFKYNAPEDFIYYILFTLEQLNYNPETIETILFGTLKENDALYDITYKYIRHVSLGHFTLNHTFDVHSLNTHNHFILLNSFS